MTRLRVERPVQPNTRPAAQQMKASLATTVNMLETAMNALGLLLAWRKPLALSVGLIWSHLSG